MENRQDKQSLAVRALPKHLAQTYLEILQAEIDLEKDERGLRNQQVRHLL